MDTEKCIVKGTCNCTALDDLPEEFMNISIIANCSQGLFENNRIELNTAANIINQMFYAATFLVGLLGNSLVIYVVAKFSKMQTPTNIYILNLAIADELFLFGIPFLITTSAKQRWPFGFVICKIYMIITSLNQFTSSLFLAIMSADRYIAVCHPISSPKFRTTTISMFVSLTAWTISALMIAPISMYATTVEVDCAENCNVFFPSVRGISGHTFFTLYTFVLGFAIPFMFIFFFYTLVILKLRTVGPENKSKEKKKSHRKVTKMVLKVIMVYLFCWLPYWVLQITLIAAVYKIPHNSFKIFVFFFTSVLSYINSAVNPILYAFLSDNFKKSFIKATVCLIQDNGAGLHAENSMFPRRQRGTSTKGNVTRPEGHSGEGSSQTPLSKEASTALTMTSRSAISQTHSPEEITTTYKNGGRLLEVPNIHHAQL